MFWCQTAPDSASRDPFRLVSMSFWHAPIILPCILSYLLFSEHFCTLWFILDFLCLSPGISHPGSFSWRMVSTAEICLLMCVHCYWSIAVPEPFQWAELGNVGMNIYTHIYTSLYIENHEFSWIPQVSVQCHGAHSRFLNFHVFTPSSLTLRNKCVSRYLTNAPVCSRYSGPYRCILALYLLKCWPATVPAHLRLLSLCMNTLLIWLNSLSCAPSNTTGTLIPWSPIRCFLCPPNPHLGQNAFFALL